MKYPKIRTGPLFIAFIAGFIDAKNKVVLHKGTVNSPFLSMISSALELNWSKTDARLEKTTKLLHEESAELAADFNTLLDIDSKDISEDTFSSQAVKDRYMEEISSRRFLANERRTEIIKRLSIIEEAINSEVNMASSSVKASKAKAQKKADAYIRGAMFALHTNDGISAYNFESANDLRTEFNTRHKNSSDQRLLIINNNIRSDENEERNLS